MQAPLLDLPQVARVTRARARIPEAQFVRFKSDRTLRHHRVISGPPVPAPIRAVSPMVWRECVRGVTHSEGRAKGLLVRL